MENQEVSSNVQATPEAQTPPASGNQDAQLAARVAELERSNEGRLRELQEERRKRQELEQRLSSVPASPAAPEFGVEPQDEVAKVLNPYLAPIKKQAEEAYKVTQMQLEKYREDAAYSFLAEKTGKSRKQIESDTDFQQRLVSTAKKWGFVGPIDEVARKAYEAMELEDLRTQHQEKAKAAQVAANASLPAGAPPAPVSNGKEYSVTEFSGMSPREFDELERKGNFRKVGDKFVYTPR